MTNAEQSTMQRPPQSEYIYSKTLKKVRFYRQTDSGYKKSFCWKHLDSNGAWQNGTGEQKIPLYRQCLINKLREYNENTVSANDGDLYETDERQPLYIVEGEKDVDTMINELKLCAVCSPHGATKSDMRAKWNDNYNGLFDDLDVVLVPDNDDVGREFMNMIAEKLLISAKSVRVVDLKREWENLPEKGDITDVLSMEKPVFGISPAQSVRNRLEALALSTAPLKLSDFNIPFDGVINDDYDMMPQSEVPKTQPTDTSIETPPVKHSEQPALQTETPPAVQPQQPYVQAMNPPPDNNKEWDKPVPFNMYKLPQFPVDALPQTVRDYVVALAESTQTPVDMSAVACIAILALCVQKNYIIRGKADWYEPLNLYALTIAEPSERKSAVVSKMLHPVIEFEIEYNKARESEYMENMMRKKALDAKQESISRMYAKGNATAEDLDEISAEVLGFEEKKPRKIFVDDITPEKLTSILSDCGGSTGIVSSEGGLFDILAGMYSKNVNIDVYLKAFSGDTIRVDRVGRASENVRNPALTMYFTVQNKVLEGLMGNKTFRGRGLTARFLYSMPKSMVGVRKFETEPMPKKVKENYKELIYDLLEEENGEHEVITLSEDAYKAFYDFATSHEPKIRTTYSDIAEWAGKIVGITLRIAGILCRAKTNRNYVSFSDYPPLVVSKSTMENAIEIGQYFIEHARAAFALMGADELTNDSKYVLKQLKESGLKEFSTKQMLDKCRRFKRAKELKRVLYHLTELGYLKEKEQEYSGKGRPPAPVFFTNPYVFEHDEEA